MFPNLPYIGFTWQITQHTGIVSADTIVGLLRGCAHLDGQPIDIVAIDTRLSELGRFTSETGRSLWRDYQQVLSEFGFIVSSASNNGMLMLTPVAKGLLAGRMSFGEAMTLQLLRYQYANGFKRTMPKGIALNDGSDVSSFSTLTDLQEACGVRIRPFVFTWEVLDRLSQRLGVRIKLSVDEMARFVLRCSSHDDVDRCCDAIIACRNGEADVSDQGDNVKRNAADWVKLLSMTSVFSMEMEGRKALITLSEQANVHAEALRWFVKNFNVDESFWKSCSDEDWFSFYGKIDPSLIALFDNPEHRLGWLVPSFIGGMKLLMSHNSQKNKPLEASPQLITYGAPGTGKSHKIDGLANNRTVASIVRTTFHPDSDYATFVGAYKPVMNGEKIAYEFRPQAFMKAYVRAWLEMAQPDSEGNAKKVVLVIEEINRGNCAQIFGDLFQLLDRGNGGYSTYPIEADTDLATWLAKDDQLGNKLAALSKPDDIKREDDWNDILSGKKLAIPPNLYIWATMNTSDQSLFPIDSAFKRRWDWEYVPITKPDKSDQPDWKERKIEVGDSLFDWWDFLVAINGYIDKITGSEDKQLGYFFVKADDATGYISADTFANKVLFYLYGDVFKSYDLPKDNCFKVGEKVLFFRNFFYSGKTEIEQGDGTKVVKKPGDVKLDVLTDFLNGLKWDGKGVTCEQKSAAVTTTMSGETSATQDVTTSGGAGMETIAVQ